MRSTAGACCLLTLVVGAATALASPRDPTDAGAPSGPLVCTPGAPIAGEAGVLVQLGSTEALSLGPGGLRLHPPGPGPWQLRLLSNSGREVRVFELFLDDDQRALGVGVVGSTVAELVPRLATSVTLFVLRTSSPHEPGVPGDLAVEVETGETTQQVQDAGAALEVEPLGAPLVVALRPDQAYRLDLTGTLTSRPVVARLEGTSEPPQVISSTALSPLRSQVLLLQKEPMLLLGVTRLVLWAVPQPKAERRGAHVLLWPDTAVVKVTLATPAERGRFPSGRSLASPPAKER